MEKRLALKWRLNAADPLLDSQLCLMFGSHATKQNKKIGRGIVDTDD